MNKGEVEMPTASGVSAVSDAEARERVPAIELREVSRAFRLESGERVNAVNRVSLTVETGEFVCVLGPSGHGKSTILNMVAGFLKPTEGDVLAGGKPVTGPGSDRGVVFQRDTLFLWKRVADNISFGMRARGVPKQEREEKVKHYLKMIELENYARAWPKQLSGGMRRRVAIATVFANEPDVLLMDEPFVGLDYTRRAKLHDVLLQLWRESRLTVFFITHDIDEALALADRIIVIVDGAVAFDTPLTISRPRHVSDLARPEAVHLRTEVLEKMGVGRGVA
jgi:NitT/TauT family transport system ATP-binding protein